MSIPKRSDLEELKAKWEAAVAENGKELVSTHIQKEFSLSVPELRQLIKLYTIQTIASQAIDDKLNNDVLPRVGITPSPEVKILYDLTVGRFVTWAPRKSKAR